MSAELLFEKIAANRGVFLRCAGAGPPTRLKRLRLTFDIGVVEVTAQRAELNATVLSADDDAGDLRGLDEEEPWWKLLGQPLTRVVKESPEALRLQWRHDDDNPRVVELKAHEGGIEAKLL